MKILHKKHKTPVVSSGVLYYHSTLIKFLLVNIFICVIIMILDARRISMKNTQDNIGAEKDAALSPDQIETNIQTNTSWKKRLMAYRKSTDNLTANRHDSGADLP